MSLRCSRFEFSSIFTAACRATPCLRAASSADERGIVAILSAIIMPILLIMIGFVVDLGRLYQARLEFKKAADAGAMAGIAASVNQSERIAGKNKQETKEYLELRARNAALESIRMNGLQSVQLSEITATFTLPDDPATGLPSMRVNISSPVNFILMDHIDWATSDLETVGTSRRLIAESTVQRDVANIILVLDISKSMACPSTEDDKCDCLTPGRTDSCTAVADKAGGKTRIEHLKKAVQDFVDRFNPNIDRIALVPYNMAGDTGRYNDHLSGKTAYKSVRFKPYTGKVGRPGFGFDPEDIRNAIGNLEATSNTNLTDGLIKGYLEAKRVGLINPNDAGNQEINWVVFGDGSPTATRLLFTPEASTGKTLPVNNPDGIGQYDYSIYSLYWAVPLGGAAIQSIAYPGPSPLVYSQDLHIDHTEANPANVPNVPYSTVTPACTKQTLEKDPTKYKTIVSNCLVNFEAHLPDHPELKYAKTLVPRSVDPDRIKESIIELRVWQELFYNSALQMSDFLRKRKGSFYVAGLGKPLKIFADPYQFDVENKEIDPVSQLNLMRKDVMLSRIANSYNQAVIERKRAGEPVYPEFSFEGYDTYEQVINASNTPRHGIYFQAIVASDLDPMFDQIATEILLRIIK